MFCCASADYDWVEHIISTRAVVQTRMITCKNWGLHFREKPPRMVAPAKKWESQGEDSACLFRDLYFGKYDPDDYDAKIIYANRSKFFESLDSVDDRWQI